MIGPTVDFSDPASIGRGIAEARGMIEQAKQRIVAARNEADLALARVSDAEVEIQQLRAILLTLEQLDVEAVPAPSDSAEADSSKLRALKVMIAINSPTNVAEVAEHMSEFSRNTVSWALWKLADEGVIVRLGHGRYAPPGHVPGSRTTNYLKVPPGFPVPSQAQIDHLAEEALAKAKRP